MVCKRTLVLQCSHALERAGHDEQGAGQGCRKAAAFLYPSRLHCSALFTLTQSPRLTAEGVFL